MTDEEMDAIAAKVDWLICTHLWDAEQREANQREIVRQVVEALGRHADVHGGYTCEEVERFCDNAQGELNWISETLVRRGYKVNFRENPSLDYWVGRALTGTPR